MLFALDKASFVYSDSVSEGALAVFFASLELSFVEKPFVTVCLFAVAMVVPKPIFALVLRSTVWANGCSLTVLLAVLPLALIDAAVMVDFSAVTIWSTVFEVTFIDRFVKVHLETPALFTVGLDVPFAFVLVIVRDENRSCFFLDSWFGVFVLAKVELGTLTLGSCELLLYESVLFL